MIGVFDPFRIGTLRAVLVGMLRENSSGRAIDAPAPEGITLLAMAHRAMRTLLTLIVATVVASCGGDTPTSQSSQASPADAASETSPETVAPLVGRWEQTRSVRTSCERSKPRTLEFQPLRRARKAPAGARSLLHRER